MWKTRTSETFHGRNPASPNDGYAVASSAAMAPKAPLPHGRGSLAQDCGTLFRPLRDVGGRSPPYIRRPRKHHGPAICRGAVAFEKRDSSRSAYRCEMSSNAESGSPQTRGLLAKVSGPIGLPVSFVTNSLTTAQLV